jgi:phosphate transport system permease protein
MSFPSTSATPLAPEPPRRERLSVPRPRRGRAQTSLLAHGEPLVWLTGGSLAVALAMIAGMLLLIVVAGIATFWPRPVYELTMSDGRQFLGELVEAESVQLTPSALEKLNIGAKTRAALTARDRQTTRTRIRTGNSFAWIDDYRLKQVSRPNSALVIERLAGGRLYGQLTAATVDGKAVATGPIESWNWYRERPHDAASAITLATPAGEVSVPTSQIVRAYPANRLSLANKVGIYLSRWWEFISNGPREANTEGGVFPAIVGTFVMTVFMSLAVVPFGVMAALYIREYARAGFMVSLVRIAVNNLAGVPSIVFGVFGLGFFCYMMGSSIDQLLFADRLPAQPTFGKGGLLWASFTLALLTLPVVIVATEEALAAVPRSMREGSYACGASKWQTIRRIVLPKAMPGIMTGLILAMARGAGEVAPLMLVGVTNLAFELPVDFDFPFVHLDRKFMHLGFHIYSLGFQSPNSEAARPLVFTTTLLLITLIGCLNLIAVWLRSRLRKRYALGQF